MARVKKDGSFFNCYMSQDVSRMLSVYSKKTGMSKTAIVEKALQKYLGSEGDSVEYDPCHFERLTEFLTKYKTGQYVYVGVIMRNLLVPKAEAIAMLNACDTLTRVVDYRCPVCNHSNFEPDTEMTGGIIICSNCDTEFDSNGDVSAEIVYRMK